MQEKDVLGQAFAMPSRRSQHSSHCSAGVDKKCNCCLIITLRHRQQRVSTARATSREQTISIYAAT